MVGDPAWTAAGQGSIVQTVVNLYGNLFPLETEKGLAM